MSKLLSTLIAGTLAIGSGYGVADGMLDVQKLPELDKVTAEGNTNAPPRGEEFDKSATASNSYPPVLPHISAHQRALGAIIATGLANAPAGGEKPKAYAILR
jgi:hypothetical protein